MGDRKNAIRCCENENCSESFKNDRLLENHQKYHCKSIHKNLRILKNGTYNRRFQTNTGDPNGEDVYINKGKIKFEGENNKWVCLDCGYNAGLYNSRSVITHWIKHKTNNYNAIEQSRAAKTHRRKNNEIEDRFHLMNLNSEEIKELEGWLDILKEKNKKNPHMNTGS